MKYRPVNKYQLLKMSFLLLRVLDLFESLSNESQA